MKLTIRGFRRITSADLEIDRLTVLTGPNEAGKTSALQALGVCLTGDPIPVDDLPKSAASRLLNTGAMSGSVSLDCGASTLTMEYPACTSSATGEPVAASPYATGRTSILDLPKADRANAIAELLGTSPTQDELAAAVGDANLTSRIWQTISGPGLGWDAAHARSVENGRTLKAQWRAITGENYGSAKSAGWTPKTWQSDLETATPDQLARERDDARGWLEAAIAASAVRAVDEDRLRGYVAAGQVAAKTLPDQQAELKGLEVAERTMREARATLRPVSNPVVTSCPHCKGPLTIESGKPVIPRVLTHEQIAERAQAISEADAALAEISTRIGNLRNTVATLQGHINRGSDAADQLAAAPVAPPATADVDGMRAKLSVAEQRLKDHTNRGAARAIADQIARTQQITEILAPDGLRLRKLTTAIGEYNTLLARITAPAGFRAVEMKHDMGVSWGDCPFMLLSSGAKRIVRAILQIGFAIMDGSHVVIVDDLDAIDEDNLRRVVLAVKAAQSIATEMIVVIAWACSRDSLVPRIDKAGATVYWVEGGAVRRMVWES